MTATLFERSTRKIPKGMKDFVEWAHTFGPQVSTDTACRYAKYADQFLAEFGPIRQGGLQETLERWRLQIATANGIPVSASTLKVKISAMRAYLDYCIAKGKLRDNPAKAIKLPTQPKRDPTPVSRKVLNRLFDYVYGLDETRIVLQDRALLDTLYGSGLRREEAATLRLLNIQSANEMRVIGKGDKQRTTIISPKEYEALRRWCLFFLEDDEMQESRQSMEHSLPKALHNRGEVIANALFDDLRRRRPEAWVFWTPENKAVAEVLADPGAWVWERVKHYGRELQEPIRPHMFRHSFATHLLGAGVDVRTIQQLLGHKNVTTTIKYLGLDEALFERTRAAHPRA